MNSIWTWIILVLLILFFIGVPICLAYIVNASDKNAPTDVGHTNAGKKLT